MCTTISLNLNDKFFFIRTLDLDYSFGKNFILTPRGHHLPLRMRKDMKVKYAFYGVGDIVDDFPLYAEGMNEMGVAIAGLHFPTMIGYKTADKGKRESLAPFELIPYILGNFADAGEACNFLRNIDIVDIPFSNEIKNTPLHFHIADKFEDYVIEVINREIEIHKNPFGVLTNAPPFPYHKYNMARYQNISALPAKDKNGGKIYSNGLMAVGLPGDFSSPSRFARAAWLRGVAECEAGLEMCCATGLAEAMVIPSGAVINGMGAKHFTRYTAVYDAMDRRVLIKKFDQIEPRILDAKKESLNSDSPISYSI